MSIECVAMPARIGAVGHLNFEFLAVVVNLIAHTATKISITRKGLQAGVSLDTHDYPLGISVSGG